MQFKHPELLWALFLLLIPILIHLFQLRRFKRTPFTNVKFLQQVVAKSRKSNTLKRWLLLITRMALFGMLILAFAQPFFAKRTALQNKAIVLYLDNSFSMQAKTERGTLLSDAVQDILQHMPENQEFSLFTNDKTFRDVTLKSIQNELLLLPHTPKQLQLEDIYLKANTMVATNENTVNDLVVISDFQQRMVGLVPDSTSSIRTNLVRLSAPEVENVAVDSVYVSGNTSESIELTALFSSNYDLESIPVSLFNDDRLIAKTSVPFDEQQRGTVTFSLPKDQVVRARVHLSDGSLTYDNTFYFNIDAKEKIKVLAIGDAPSRYLSRIYTEDEFQFESRTLKTLNYGGIAEQDLIVLNELETLPNALITGIGAFSGKDGHVLVIPGTEINYNDYNRLLSNAFGTTFTEQVDQERSITNISFSHPLFQNVFEQQVTNFQYPKVARYFQVNTTVPSILSFQDQNPFLFGADSFFAFTASLSHTNSDFKNSPLIVPTLYNIGVNSLKLPQLYYTLDREAKVDVPLKLSKDNILKARKGSYEFIPQQESFANKVALSFYENPEEDGIYTLMNAETAVRHLSFNYAREESKLEYADPSRIAASSVDRSLPEYFDSMQKDNSINELWKWFVILALLFAGIEVLIQKYLK